MILEFKTTDFIKKLASINWKLFLTNSYLAIISVLINGFVLGYVSRHGSVAAADCIRMNYFQSLASILIFGLGSNFINNIIAADVGGKREFILQIIRRTSFLILFQSVFAQGMFICFLRRYWEELSVLHLIAASATILIGVLINLFSQVLFSLGKFRSEAHVNFFFVLSNLFSLFFGVFTGYGLIGFIYFKSLYLFLVLISQILIIKKEFKTLVFLVPESENCFASLKNTISWFDFFLNVSNNFISNLPYLVVSKTMSNQQLIVVELTKRIFEFLNSFIYRLSFPLTSIYVRFQVLFERKMLVISLMNRTFNLQALLRTISFVAIFFGLMLYYKLMNYEFSVVIILYSITFYFSGISQIFGIFFNAIGRQKYNFVFSISISLVAMLGYLIVNISKSGYVHIVTIIFLLMIILINIVLILRGWTFKWPVRGLMVAS